MGSEAFDVNQGLPVVVAEWILMGLSCAAVIARCVSKSLKDRKFKSDDYLMVTSVILAILFEIMLTLSLQHGFGRHQTFLSAYDRTEANKYIFVSQGLAILAPMFGRVSFCMYMKSILSGTASESTRIMLVFVLCSQVFVNVVATVLTYAQCSNIAAVWDPDVAAVSICMDPYVDLGIGYFQCGFNSLTDLYLTILPATVVWRSQKKSAWTALSLAAILSFGSFVVAASVMKTNQIHILNSREDVTWDYVKATLWASLETSLVAVVASTATVFYDDSHALARGPSTASPLPTFSTQISSSSSHASRRSPRRSLARRVADRTRGLLTGFTLPWRTSDASTDGDDGRSSSSSSSSSSMEEAAMTRSRARSVLIMRTKEVSIQTTTTTDHETMLESGIVPAHLRLDDERGIVPESGMVPRHLRNESWSTKTVHYTL
ncbi:hypothetical protein MBLNU459_g2774t1 [Dothideomycetes sp. NU459]